MRSTKFDGSLQYVIFYGVYKYDKYTDLAKLLIMNCNYKNISLPKMAYLILNSVALLLQLDRLYISNTKKHIVFIQNYPRQWLIVLS